MTAKLPDRPGLFARGLWRTLRFRLAIWNAAVVIITAIVTLMVLRQGVRWALIHELDLELIDDASGIALEIASSPAADAQLLKEELDRWARGHGRHEWYVKLLGARGEVIWQSDEAQAENPKQATADELPPFTLGNHRVVQIRSEGSLAPVQAIRVGASLDRIAEDMARIDRGVLLAASAVMVIAPLCGYFLAARAARTVGDIIETAARLRPSHLDERLPIRGTGDELDHLAQTVNSLLDRIAAYFDTKRDFLANAAHELRTPLAAIRSSVEVALGRSERSAEEYEELLVDVINMCAALETLVNQLLLLSEVDADLPEIKFEPVELRTLVEKSVDMFSGVADSRNVSLRVGPLESAMVYGNGAHLRQVLNNLLDNAIKYTPPGGVVDVSLVVDDVIKQAHISVSDTGHGITLEDQRRIFDRFYRAESARLHGAGVGGTGLGLSICRSIVQNHGGAIACRSEPNCGATFDVTLPTTLAVSTRSC